MKKICIIGGGISGLVAAFLLKKKGFNVTLFDKSGRVGGNIETVKRDGFLIEQGPNSLLKSPRLVDLIKDLKLEAEVLPANSTAKKRYVLQNGKLTPLPMSIAKMAFGSFFSAKAKMRLLKEPLIKSKSNETESVAAFFERRLGREIVEKAADPFISGIYAGDPEKLSIKAAFPRLFELEKEYGSLLFGSIRAKSEKADANFPRTFTFKNGLQTLTEKLADFLGESVKIKTEILQIEKLSKGKFSVKTNFGEGTFAALIIATPAESAANLIENLDENLSEQLKSIYYPPVAMFFFGVKKDSLAQNLDGFGFLIPGSEKRKILGTIWNSAVFSGRAPENFHLLTSFAGGARNPEIFEKSDEEIFEIVYAELRQILGLREKPEFQHIKRWRKAIPQYNVGYDKIETAIENFENENRGIFFCSNFYKGISVGDCFKNAFQTADEIERFLKDRNLQG
jgi:oxygen-dependent protoporphyrinogen oxidase